MAPDLAGWVHASSDAGLLLVGADAHGRALSNGWTSLAARRPLAGGGRQLLLGRGWHPVVGGQRLDVDARGRHGRRDGVMSTGKGFVTCVGAAARSKSVVATARCRAAESGLGPETNVVDIGPNLWLDRRTQTISVPSYTRHQRGSATRRNVVIREAAACALCKSQMAIAYRALFGVMAIAYRALFGVIMI